MGLARIVSLLGAVGVLATAASCEAIVAKAATQCASTTECRARGGDFATSVCSTQGFCEALVIPDAGTIVGSACRASSDCRARLGAPARCVEGACFPLLLGSQDECTIIGAAEDDNAVLWAAIVPHGGAAGLEFNRAREAIRLVTSEWNSRAQGDLVRDIALVECDESRLDETLPHLLDLRPQAFIGPFTNTRFRDYIKTKAIETPTFAPTVDDTLLVEQPDSRRQVDSCIPNLHDGVKSFQRAIDVIAQKVATDRGIAAPRIVVAKTNDPGDAPFAAEVETGLTIGGKPASSLSSFSDTTLSVDIHSNSAPSLLASAQSIGLLKPDIVVLTSSIVAEELTSSIDLRWSALNGAAAKPVYLMMGRWMSVVESLTTNKSPTQGRFYAVDWSTDAMTDANYGTFAGEMLARNVAPGYGGARALDCTYAALYGAFASSTTAKVPMGTTTVAQLVAGVSFATNGSESLSLTDDQIPRALTFLGASPPLSTKLVGTVNPSVAFQANGVIKNNATLYCVTSETATPARAWAATGMTFDAATGNQNGSIACP